MVRPRKSAMAGGVAGAADAGIRRYEEHQRRFYKEHPEELEKKRRAAEKREREIERWHEWFRDDPKAALAEMLDEIKRDEESSDD